MSFYSQEPRTGITIALLSTVVLAGCGSSPEVEFYALSVVPAGTGPEAISSPVQLTAVHLPPLLDRQKMVRMTDENRVTVSETDRWSADLGEMVRNVLSQDLAARLPAGRVIPPEAPAPSGTGTLVVTLTRFAPDAKGRVTLAGSWALLKSASGALVLERDFQLDEGPAPDADAAAAAMSRALGRLSSVIAAGLAESGF